MAADVWAIASSVGTVLGGGAAAVAAWYAAVAARASNRTAQETRQALALHFQPAVFLEVSEKSFGGTDGAVRLDIARDAQIGQDLQMTLRHLGGAVALVSDEVRVRWVTITGQPRERVMVVPSTVLLPTEAVMLELTGLPISGYGPLGEPLVETLSTLELRVRDAPTGSRWVWRLDYNPVVGFPHGISTDFALEEASAG